MLQAGNTRGHKANYCPTLAKMCFLCGKQGHEARNCRSGGRKSGGQGKDGNPVQRGQVIVGCLVKSPDLNATPRGSQVVYSKWSASVSLRQENPVAE